jgi:hypothetical protein
MIEWSHKQPDRDGYIRTEWNRLGATKADQSGDYYSSKTGQKISGNVWIRACVCGLYNYLQFEYADDQDLIEMKLYGE